MKLIIIRHGETIENQKGILQGHLPSKLSEAGIEQAKKVALRMKNEKIDFIYSSDLARAKDTAEEIAKFHTNVPLKFVKELRERNLGEFEGKTRAEAGLVGENAAIRFAKPKYGESTEQLFNRAKDFVFKILKEHPNDTVLFVCHNGIKKALVCAITGKETKDITSIEGFKNTAVSIFEINPNKKYVIHTFNCAKHME